MGHAVSNRMPRRNHHPQTPLCHEGFIHWYFWLLDQVMFSDSGSAITELRSGFVIIRTLYGQISPDMLSWLLSRWWNSCRPNSSRSSIEAGDFVPAVWSFFLREAMNVPVAQKHKPPKKNPNTADTRHATIKSSVLSGPRTGIPVSQFGCVIY